MATPVRAHAAKRGISFFAICAERPEKAHRNQNSTSVIPTLKKLTPKGPTSEGEICLTKLRLVAKNKLVKRTAIWAFCVAFTTKVTQRTELFT